MERIIAACGNDCNACPRHLPKTDDELRNTAELWHKIGYRDHIVTNAEIQCSGCRVGNWCRYKIVDCVTEKGVENCGQCGDYPCVRIQEAFEKTTAFAPDCRRCCTENEFQLIEKAFFEKRKNLDEINSRAR